MKAFDVVVILLATDEANVAMCELIGDMVPMLQFTRKRDPSPPQVVVALSENAAVDAHLEFYHLRPAPLVIPERPHCRPLCVRCCIRRRIGRDHSRRRSERTRRREAAAVQTVVVGAAPPRPTYVPAHQLLARAAGAVAAAPPPRARASTLRRMYKAVRQRAEGDRRRCSGAPIRSGRRRWRPSCSRASRQGRRPSAPRGGRAASRGRAAR